MGDGGGGVEGVGRKRVGRWVARIGWLGWGADVPPPGSKKYQVG